MTAAAGYGCELRGFFFKKREVNTSVVKSDQDDSKNGEDNSEDVPDVGGARSLQVLEATLRAHVPILDLLNQ